MIEITITATGPSRYLAALGERILASNTRTPLLCAARILLAEGMAPNAIIGMRRAASDRIAMSGRIGRLAGLTVRDDDRGPRFEPYRAHPAAMPIAEPPSARQRPTAENPTGTSPGPKTPAHEPIST